MCPQTPDTRRNDIALLTQVMAGWHAWHSAQTALYRGPRPMLVLRNLMQLIIPLATAFK